MKTKEKLPIIKPSTQVPKQYLGYSLQATRFLAGLLEEEIGTTLSLEVFSDVGITKSDGSQVAEEDKSIGENNLISDRSEGLWKTFSNWIDAINQGTLHLGKTKFVIYVSRPIIKGFVYNFSNAKTLELAHSTLQNTKIELWGKFPDFTLKDSIADEIKKYVSNVFDTDETIVEAIIQSFKLINGSGNPIEDLKKDLGKKLIAPELIDDVLIHAVGWTKIHIDEMIGKGIPANITVDEFRKELISFARAIDQRHILFSFAQTPTEEEIESDLKIRIYVKQLELIGADYTQKLRAVNDFLRSVSDRTEWAKRGFVNETSFDDFEENLVRTWENISKQTEILLSNKSDVERGKYSYLECSQHDAHVQGLVVPSHFVPGSYHMLSDNLLIGWHPDYKSELENLKTDENEK